MVAQIRTFNTTLNPDACRRIIYGAKIMEFRLYRGQWREINAGHNIFFHNSEDPRQIITVKLLAKHNYPTFIELLQDFPPHLFNGRPSIEVQIKGLRKYYSENQEAFFTVVGLRFEFVKFKQKK